MHFTGQVWRPPFEAHNALLQVTAGCTHNKCKFCSLYDGTQFRMSPISEVEQDLAELKRMYPQARRVFLTGANPLGLSHDKLTTIAAKIKEYLPRVTSIGGFARIADIKRKTQEEINELHAIGYDGISFGTETGDDITLAYMNKGNTAADIVEQLHKRFDYSIEDYSSGIDIDGYCRRAGELFELCLNYFTLPYSEIVCAPVGFADLAPIAAFVAD